MIIPGIVLICSATFLVLSPSHIFSSCLLFFRPVSTITVVAHFHLSLLPFHIPVIFVYLPSFIGDRGGTVVKVLCYKIGRSLVRSQLVSLDFSLT